MKLTCRPWEVWNIMVIDLELCISSHSVCNASESRTADDSYTGLLKVGWEFRSDKVCGTRGSLVYFRRRLRGR
jgi:hypothetical protein